MQEIAMWKEQFLSSEQSRMTREYNEMNQGEMSEVSL